MVGREPRRPGAGKIKVGGQTQIIGTLSGKQPQPVLVIDPVAGEPMLPGKGVLSKLSRCREI